MKTRAIVVLGMMLVLISAGNVRAQGYCFSTSACNDFYFELGTGVGSQTIHGYEYGCGQHDRLISGTVRIIGATAYLSFFVSSGSSSLAVGPYGSTGAFNGSVNVNTGSAPTVYYQYHYATGTSPAMNGHGGTIAYSAAGCAPPAIPQRESVTRPDLAVSPVK